MLLASHLKLNWILSSKWADKDLCDSKPEGRLRNLIFAVILFILCCTVLYMCLYEKKTERKKSLYAQNVCYENNVRWWWWQCSLLFYFHSPFWIMFFGFQNANIWWEHTSLRITWQLEWHMCSQPPFARILSHHYEFDELLMDTIKSFSLLLVQLALFRVMWVVCKINWCRFYWEKDEEIYGSCIGWQNLIKWIFLVEWCEHKSKIGIQFRCQYIFVQ